MVRAGKYLTLATLISVLFLAVEAKAGKDPSQFSLSLDAQGEAFVPDNIPLFPTYSLNGSSYTAVGGAAFADWRPVRVVSLGLGGEYFYFPSNSSFKLTSFDLGGRIFPFSTSDGEVYFQGGVGRNLLLETPTYGHFHGYAGIGYRYFLDKGLALDAGVQYDFYSPIGAPSSGVGARVGLTFLFGRDRWPLPSVDVRPEDIVQGGQYPGGSLYTWREGDTLKTIAARVLGAEDLYPALVDANPDLLTDPAKMRVGMKLRVPDSNFSDDQLTDIHEKILSGTYYRLEEYSSRLPYKTDPNWRGPRTYVWKEGDDLKSVASKLYNDEDLYPILVDANKKRLIHPVNLVPGVKLTVPAPPTDEWLDSVHERALEADYCIWWKTVSETGQ